MSYVATVAYDGSDSDQCIALDVGDILTDVHMLDDHWYIGYNERSRVTGAFPRSSVEPSSGDPECTPLPGTVQQNTIYTNLLKSGRGGLNIRKDDQQVRFSDVKLEHSISHQESVTSWQDSSFEDSFRDKLANYDNIETKSRINTQINKADNGKDRSAGDYAEIPRLNMFKHLMASTDRLIHSDKHEKKRIKALFGILFGIAIGIVLFLLSAFSFGYSYVVAGIIVAVFTVLISLGLAFSTHCRCIVALVFPSFLTGQGRAVLLSVILSLMLTHPIANITYNTKVTGSSMACIVEIAANQSREIQKQLVTPLAELAEYIDKQKSDLRTMSDKISAGFSVVRSALDKADQSVNDAQKTINALEQSCKDRVQKTFSDCTSKCSFPGCSVFCQPLLNVVDSCNGFNFTDFALTQAARNLRKTIDDLVKYFLVDIQIHGDFNATANTSKSFHDMQKEVDEDIGQKTIVVITVAKILGKLLSLTLLLLFLQSFWYLRNYLAKDAYDNIYITKQFRQLDKDNEKKGLKKILPLKKNEEEKYINTASWMLNSVELAHCKISFIIVLLHFLMFLLVVIFDVSLWYILDLVSRHGDVELEIGGAGAVNVEVEGKGQVADFYRLMIKGINIRYNYTADIDIGPCLPNPKKPAYEMIPVFIILYIVVTACVFLQGFGVRLRRKICSYYYPEQEFARLDYLHKKIRHKRVGFLRFIRQQIVSSHKENQVKNQLRFSTWLAFRCPILAKVIHKDEQLECTSCEQTENSFSHVRVTKCKGKSGGWSCDAAYCQECWTLLSDVCPLCQTDEVAMRD